MISLQSYTSNSFRYLEDADISNHLELSSSRHPLKVLTREHRGYLSWINLNTYIEEYSDTLKELLRIYGSNFLVYIKSNYFVRFQIKGVNNGSDIVQKQIARHHLVHKTIRKINIW